MCLKMSDPLSKRPGSDEQLVLVDAGCLSVKPGHLGEGVGSRPGRSRPGSWEEGPLPSSQKEERAGEPAGISGRQSEALVHRDKGLFWMRK